MIKGRCDILSNTVLGGSNRTGEEDKESRERRKELHGFGGGVRGDESNSNDSEFVLSSNLRGSGGAQK